MALITNGNGNGSHGAVATTAAAAAGGGANGHSLPKHQQQQHGARHDDRRHRPRRSRKGISNQTNVVLLCAAVGLLLLISNNLQTAEFSVRHLKQQLDSATNNYYVSYTFLVPPVTTTTTSTGSIVDYNDQPYDPNNLPPPKPIPYSRQTKIFDPQVKMIGPNGQKGYVHNPTYVRNHPRINITKSSITDPRICMTSGESKGSSAAYNTFGDPESQLAMKKIRHNIDNVSPDDISKVKVFCAIYTYEGAVYWTDTIWDTWGKRCDGILFASTVSDVTTQHVMIRHVSIHEGQYKGMWQKVRSMHSYIYTNFLNDYDYYYFCGDDTYVIVDNLKQFLASDPVQTYQAANNGIFYSGGWIYKGRYSKDEKNWDHDFYYMGGGSGYVFSREVMRRFVERALPVCAISKDVADEDVQIAYCFRKYLNVTPYDSRDEFGATRFHQLKLDVHAVVPNHPPAYRWQVQFFRKMLRKLDQHKGWPVYYHQQYISNSSIAFHKHYSPFAIQRMDNVFYDTYKEACEEYMPEFIALREQRLKEQEQNGTVVVTTTPTKKKKKKKKKKKT